MLNRTKKILISAATLAVLPAAANAVTISYTFDAGDFYISTSRNGTYTALPAADYSVGSTTTSEVITVPVGSYIRFGVDTALSSATGGTATTLTGGALPTGVGQTSFGFNSSNASVLSLSSGPGAGAANTSGAAMAVGGTNGIQAPLISPTATWLSNGAPEADGVGGSLVANGLSYSNGPNPTAPSNPAAGAALPIATAYNISVGAIGANGTSAKLTLLPYLAGMGYVTTAVTKSGSNAFGYHGLGIGDSTGTAPTLTINIGTPVTSTTAAATHAIISLTAGSSPVSGYGTVNDGVITLVKTGGGYPPTPAVGFLASNNASVSVLGFSGTDTEVYALELAQGGTNISTGASVLTNIVADINGTNGLTNASTGVTASVIAPGSTYAKLFPGYDVLITSTSGLSGPTDELGFDFTALGEQNTADAGITVTAVSAVPEPATAAGAILGAAGLLLGRRKSKTVAV